jgi:hypothetical protein
MENLCFLVNSVTIEKPIYEVVDEALLSLGIIETSIAHGIMPSYDYFFEKNDQRLSTYRELSYIKKEQSIIDKIKYYFESSESEDKLLAIKEIDENIIQLWMYSKHY